MDVFEIMTGQGKKGRSFRATLAGWMNYDGGWAAGKANGPARPIWMLWTSSNAELKAFVANLRLGRRAACGSQTIELPKTAGYAYHWLSKEAVEITVPSLFTLDPARGSQTESSTGFVLAPPRRWLDAQTTHPCPSAALFAAYINRRTGVPVLEDAAFHQVLYETALDHDFLRLSMDRPSLRGPRCEALFHGSGLTELGIEDPAAFQCTDLDAFVIDVTTTFLETTDYGQTREPSIRGILSNASDAGTQLRLFAEAV